MRFFKFLFLYQWLVCYGIQKWMAHKMNFVIVFALIKFFFKRQDHVHLINITSDRRDPVLLPGPDLGGYIKVGSISILFAPLCNAQIEPGIVDKNNCVRLIGGDIFFAETYIFKDGSKILNHLNKTDESQLAIMFYHRAAHFLHQVTSPKTEFCL